VAYLDSERAELMLFNRSEIRRERLKQPLTIGVIDQNDPTLRWFGFFPDRKSEGKSWDTLHTTKPGTNSRRTSDDEKRRRKTGTA
jgi:hypothetical protein